MAVALAALSLSGAKDNNLDGATCDIKLYHNPHRELSPLLGSEICGQIVINTSAPVAYANLWIQLEGTAIARFTSKFDGRVTSNYINETVLPPNEFLFLVFGNEDASKGQKKSLKPGTHTFPFRIHLDDIIYPTCFKSPYGQVQYRLAVYVGKNLNDERKVAAAHLNLSCKGYRNLQGEEDLLQPVQIVRSKEKTFSRRLISKATLNLEKQAFVRGEGIKFSLMVENPLSENVNKIRLELVVKTIYHGTPPKTTSIILRKVERKDHTKEPEIHWSGDLLVPNNAMPTFCTVNKCLDIQYFVMFFVEIDKRPNLKGEVAVAVGTTDGTTKSRDHHVMRPIDDLDTISLPSGYVAVSSRRPSTETLPPVYYDAVVQDDGLGNFSDAFRPRSSSNTM